MMLFCPCIELVNLISCVTAPLDEAGMVVLVGGNISSLRYFGTAACWERVNCMLKTIGMSSDLKNKSFKWHGILVDELDPDQ